MTLQTPAPTRPDPASTPAATAPRADDPAFAPTVTILFLAYNQAQWARASAEACLAQVGGPYEIILSDDGSTDGTDRILREVAAAYRGPHRVIARRSPGNVGIGQHYNDLIDLARGELLVTMAADDFSVPDRVARQLAAWEAHGRQPDLIASHVVDMDPEGALHDVIRVDDLGAWPDLPAWAARRPYIIGATHAFTRRMMRHFGPLDPKVFYEDQVMVFRALARGGAITVDAPLVHYRRGGTSAKPVFDDAEHRRRWVRRQTIRELAEMHQLMADAAVIGRQDLMETHLGLDFYRTDYQFLLSEATTDAQRWALVRRFGKLPLWWRTRKALHHIFPNATHRIKRALSLFHRRHRGEG
ncbi:MAG: hypothetical protein RL456_1490 [Pseudomonadota bacterium]|jgi:glycosyltransferase involved in cell wall biosynthesis